MSDTWNRYIQSLNTGNTDSYEDEEEKRRKGIVNDSFSTWQKYLAEINNGQIAQLDKTAQKEQSKFFKSTKKIKEDDSWKHSGLEWTDTALNAKGVQIPDLAKNPYNTQEVNPVVEDKIYTEGAKRRMTNNLDNIILNGKDPNRFNQYLPTGEYENISGYTMTHRNDGKWQVVNDHDVEAMMKGTLNPEDTVFDTQEEAQKYLNEHSKPVMVENPTYATRNQTIERELRQLQAKDNLTNADIHRYKELVNAQQTLFSEQKKSNDNKASYLENQLKENKTLPEEDQLWLSQYTYSNLDKDERQAVDLIMNASKREYGRQLQNDIYTGTVRLQNVGRAKESNDELNQARDILKNKGWTDEKIDSEISRFKQYSNYLTESEMMQNLNINPNASGVDKFGQSMINTMWGISTAPSKGINAISGMIGNGYYGKDTHNPHAFQANSSEYGYGQVKQNAIGNDHTGWQWAYDAGVTTGESLYTMLIGQNVGGIAASAGGKVAAKAAELGSLVPFSANAFQSSYKDAVDRGFSQNQALGYGIASGSIEALTELFSLDRAWKLAEGTKIGRNLFVSMGVQSGIEGFEELTSDYANRFADYVSVEVGKTGKTQRQLDIESFMYDEYGNKIRNEREAARMAAEKFNKDALNSFAMGAVSGGVTAPVMVAKGLSSSKRADAVGNVVSNKFNNLDTTGDSEFSKQQMADKERYANNPTQYVVDQFKVENKEDENTKKHLQEIADKEKNGKKLSISDKAYLFENGKITQDFINTLVSEDTNAVVPNEYRKTRTNVTQEEVEDRMNEAVGSKNMEALSQAYSDGINSRDAEVRKATEDYFNSAMVKGRLESQGVSTDVVMEAARSTEDSYKSGLNGEEINTDILSNENRIAYNAGQQTRIEQEARTTIKNASDVQNTQAMTKDGNAVRLTGRFNSDGIVTSDGNTISVDDIDRSKDRAIDRAYVIADNNFDDVETKNAYMSGIEDNTNVEAYSIAFKTVFDSADEGLSFEQATSGVASTTFLSDDQKKLAYDEGVRVRNERIENNVIKEVENSFGVKSKGTGTVVNASEVKLSNEENMIAKALAKKLGVTVNIVDQVIDNGKVVEGARGAFTASNGVVQIRADRLSAIAHEGIGEFTKKFNNKGYNEAKTAVIDFMADRIGTDTFNRVLNAEYTELYKSHGRDASVSNMSDELFNDALAQIFSTEEGSKAFADWLSTEKTETEAKGIKQTIVDMLKSIRDAIAKLFGSDNRSAIAKAAGDDIGQFAKQILDEVDKAIEVYSSVAPVKTSDSNTELSIESKVNNVTERIGISYDQETDSAYPTDFSLESWNRSDYISERNKAAQELAKALGVSVKKATKYIDDVNGVAKMIADKFAKDIISRGKEFSIQTSPEIGDDAPVFSLEVTDKEQIKFLENQKHITTYRSFQLIDGGLYAPMAAMDYEVDKETGKKLNKKLGYRSQTGHWEQATEAIEVARKNFEMGKKGKDSKTKREYAKFDLEGGDNQTGGVAYNPYLHSSNVVLNDQFSAAYRRNLVVVECEVPSSELDSGYQAELSKDPVGWREWKAGKVAGKIAKLKDGFERKVFLSRWMKPVRILDDSEVAQMYKSYLDGTDVEVPWNVVTPSLRQELEKVGVPINYDPVSFGSKEVSFEDVFGNSTQFSLEDTDGKSLTKDQIEYFKDSKVRDENGRLKVMYHGTESAGFNVFDASLGFASKAVFFTPSNDVARGYSGTHDIYAPKAYKSTDEVNEAISNAMGGDDQYRVVEENGKYVLYDGEDFADSFDDINDVFQGWLDYSGYGGNSANYKVYLNVTNPLIVEADNRNWDDLPGQFKTTNEYAEYAKKNGYDGVIFKNITDGGLYNSTNQRNEVADVVTVFNSNQIKSVNNVLPTIADDIRFSLEDEFIDMSAYEGDEFDFMNKETINILEEGMKALKNKGRENTDALRDYYAKQYASDHDGREASDTYLDAQVKGVTDRIKREWLKDGRAYLGGGKDMSNGADARTTGLYNAVSEYLNSMGYRVGELEYNKNGATASITQDDSVKPKSNTFRVRAIARKLKSEFNSNYSEKELTSNLEKAFAYMETQEHVDYKTMLGILEDIARPVIEESGTLVGEQDYKDFLKHYRGISIRLTDQQVKEVESAFGSYNNYRQKMMPITISKSGDITLDQIWGELGNNYSEFFPFDTSEGSMPFLLMDALEAMKPRVENDFNGDQEELAKDAAMRIVEEYVGGATASKMRDQIKRYEENIKKDYEDKLKRYENNPNAALLAKNKEKAKKAKERKEITNRKRIIGQNVSRLETWLDHPTKKKHVPTEMVRPVLDFVRALEFVTPNIERLADGTWQKKVVSTITYNANGSVKRDYTVFKGKTRAEVLDKYYERMGNLAPGTKKADKWRNKMQSIKDLYEKANSSERFEDNALNAVVDNLDASLYEKLKDIFSRDDNLSINQLGLEDLKVIDKVLTNVMHSIDQGTKAYTDPSADVVEMSKKLIDDSKGKSIKSRLSTVEGFRNFFRLDNLNPRVYMKLLGDSGMKLYNGLRKGFNQRVWDIKEASDYMDSTLKDIGITQKDIQGWSGATARIREIPVSGGTLRMTEAQMMSLYETMKREGAYDRVVGGIRVANIERGKLKPAIKQKETQIHITQSDLSQISKLLTTEQKNLADRMQKFLADNCSRWGNETSQKLYGYQMFEDPTYYPYRVYSQTLDTKDSTEQRDSYVAVENQGFTKALQPGAENTLMVEDIFDVFTRHVEGMANYHAYSLANKDTLRVLNYKEKVKTTGGVDYITTKEAINKICNTESGVSYLTDFLKDLNRTQRSNYKGAGLEKFMGGYKAAAVGGNVRVILQQPTAYIRALNDIDAKYLFTVNPVKALKYKEFVKEQNATALWKSWGYFESSIGRSMKDVIVGQTSIGEKIKNAAMSPAGVADDVTWGFLYLAVENEQRAKYKGQNLTAEEFREKVNDRFDEVIDKTQVVDSTLHRSAMMRSTDKLNVIQTAFMAEPTKSYNMIAESILDDSASGKDKGKKISRSVMAFLLSSIATSAAAAVADAFRYDTDDDEWEKVWLEQFYKNIKDNINPLNLLPIVKDIAPNFLNVFEYASTGESPTDYTNSSSRLDTAAIASIADALLANIKWYNGDSKKSGYGIVMANLKPISYLTGIPLYNLTRDSVALINQFTEDITTTVKTAKDYKSGVVKAIDDERGSDAIKQEVTEAIENNVSIKDERDYLTSKYKEVYADLVASGDEEEAKKYADLISPAFSVTGMSDEDIDSMLNDWTEEAVTYKGLDDAIRSGVGIAEAISKVQEAKDDDKIVEHIMKNFGSSVEYERTNNTESMWETNVESALQAVDGTYDYDTVKETLELKAKEKAEKAQAKEEKSQAKDDFFKATESNDGVAARQAIKAMADMGMDAKAMKTAVSTKYHEEWKNDTDKASKDKAKRAWINATTLINKEMKVKKPEDPTKNWNEWEKKQK